MNAQEQLNQVITILEKEIADEEQKLKDFEWELKVKKARLKQLKTPPKVKRPEE